MRFARIVPCLLALLVISSLLHLSGIGYVIYKTTLARALFAALTFHINQLQIWYGYLPVNWTVLWSLSIEEVFYLSYPLLCRFLPGRSMLLAGADPIDAVRLQLILLYTLLGSVALAALLATTLAYRNFFTAAHQLRDLPAR